MTETSDYLIDALTQMVSAFRALREHYDPVNLRQMQYLNLEDLVLQHGTRFVGRKRPKGVRKQPNRLCFKNSVEYVYEHPDHIYCEGFGIHIVPIPIYHAWVLDPAGQVIDVTWKTPEVATYVGIPLKFEYVQETLVRRRIYETLGANTKILTGEHGPKRWKLTLPQTS